MPADLTFIASTLIFALGVSSSLAFSPTFPYGETKVRGVNLGGWLVIEPFITPSLFQNTGNDAIIDEYTFGQYQNYNDAYSVLKTHWDTWITEDDFVQIKAAGLNHVRIPIGYWAFDVSEGEPYIQGQVAYLQSAVGWAADNDIKVIVDLHGAPGSQNGYDNSGQRLSAPTWQTKQDNIDRTSNVIKEIVAMFIDQTDTVSVIAPLNEPAGWYDQQVLDVTTQYWRDSYGNIRYPYGTSTQGNTLELIHDAFQPLSYWNGFATDYDGVAMDTHIYQMFTDSEITYSNTQSISAFCAAGSSLSSFDLWLIVGEWTPGTTDCAPWVNGRGIGARYDGTYAGDSTYVGSCSGKTGSSAGFSTAYKTQLRKSWEAQVTTYEQAEGWLMWTWKTEAADEWSYQAGLAGGWIPQDPTERQYPGICD